MGGEDCPEYLEAENWEKDYHLNGASTLFPSKRWVTCGGKLERLIPEGQNGRYQGGEEKK